MTSPETLELEAVDAALAGRYVAPEHAELAELALLLRDDKPEPAAAWATHLDRRVESGFPARSRRRFVWLRKAVPAIAVAAVLLLIVATAALIEPSGDDEGDAGGGGSAQTMERPTKPTQRRRRPGGRGTRTPTGARTGRRSARPCSRWPRPGAKSTAWPARSPR